MTASTEGLRRSRVQLPHVDLRTVGTVAGVLLALLAASVAAGVSALVTPIGPLVVAGGVLLCIAIYVRPVVGAVLVAAVAPAAAGLSRGVGVPGLKVSELLTLVAVLVLVVRRPARWRAITGVDVALTLFAVCTGALAIYHIAAGDTPLDTTALVAVQPAFLLLSWWGTSRAVADSSDVDTVLRWVLLVSTVPSVLAIFQYFNVPGVRNVLATVTGQAAYAAAQAAAAQDSTDYVATAFRVTGPFTIWHSLGGYLLFPIVLGILVLLRGRRTLLPMPVVVAVLALDLSALVLSVTVTLLLWLPIAALVAAALAGVFKRAVTGLVVIGVVAGLVFSSALTSRLQQETTASASTAAAAGDGSGTSLLDVQTLQYRFLVWERDYLPVVGRAAAIGLGTDTPPSAIFTSTENQYLTYLLRGGIVQVIVSLVALGALFVRALRYARQPRAPGRMAAQALCGILVFMPLGMMVWPYLSNAGLSYVLFSVGGAVLSVDGRRRPQAAEAPQPERALQSVRG